MRTHLACSLLLALPCFAGCFAPNGNGGGGDDVVDPVCTAEPTYTIDLGASIDHTAGVDPGYYVEYDGSGAWHIEWTCDTALSDQGCIFSGYIIAPTPSSGDVGATCYECESDDQLTTQPSGTDSTEIDFNTVTSTGIDGVDFVTTPGATIEINFQVNSIDQDDLVFLPSNGQTTNPTCMPDLLKPSAP